MGRGGRKMLGQSRGAVLGEFLGKTELSASGVVLFGGRGHHGSEQGSLDRISRVHRAAFIFF
jgi:hypothetical protein